MSLFETISNVISTVGFFPELTNVSKSRELLNSSENDKYSGFEQDCNNINQDKSNIYNDVNTAYSKMKDEY